MGKSGLGVKEETGSVRGEGRRERGERVMACRRFNGQKICPDNRATVFWVMFLLGMACWSMAGRWQIAARKDWGWLPEEGRDGTRPPRRKDSGHIAVIVVCVLDRGFVECRM